MDIGQVIRRRRQSKGWNLAELAHAADTDAGNISRIERGKQACSQEMLEKIAKALGVRVSQIFSEAENGIESSLKGKPMERESAEKLGKSWLRNVEPGPDIFSKIPLISWVQAGHWNEIMDIYQPGDGEEMVMVTGRVGPHAFALRVVGDSMYDQSTGKGFPPGALLVVDPDTEARNGSYVVVRLDDAQEATFKQLVIDGGKQYLKPLNPRYPILEINSHATICGVVKRFILEASFD